MSVALPLPRRRRSAAGVPGGALAMGVSMLYLSVIVLLPLAAVVAHSFEGGIDTFWNAVTSRQAVSALRFTILASLAAAAINALFGTVIAWVLVRDQFPGKAAVNALIDLPFALPTIVAGLTLIALYGPAEPGRHQRRADEDVGAAGDAVRDAAVRDPRGPAGPARARPRHGGGGGVARRAARGRSSRA